MEKKVRWIDGEMKGDHVIESRVYMADACLNACFDAFFNGCMNG